MFGTPHMGKRWRSNSFSVYHLSCCSLDYMSEYEVYLISWHCNAVFTFMYLHFASWVWSSCSDLPVFLFRVCQVPLERKDPGGLRWEHLLETYTNILNNVYSTQNSRGQLYIFLFPNKPVTELVTPIVCHRVAQEMKDQKESRGHV